MEDRLKWKKSVMIAIVATVGLLASVTGFALSCVEGKPETVIYEISSVQVNGEMTNSDEFGTVLEVSGTRFDVVVVYAAKPMASSRMVFEREGTQ